MHFREQGKSLQLIRTTYDAERGRGVQTVVGRIPQYTYEIPHEIAPLLTPEETSQLNDYLSAVKAARYKLELANSLNYIAASQMKKATEALVDGIPPKSADELWSAMEDLAKALRKAGHPRPAKAPKVAE